jgi:hypothetical protein
MTTGHIWPLPARFFISQAGLKERNPFLNRHGRRYWKTGASHGMKIAIKQFY